MHSPKKWHLEAANHVLKVSQGTPGKGILFKKSENRDIEGFADANWVVSIEDNKSTTEYCTK